MERESIANFAGYALASPLGTNLFILAKGPKHWLKRTGKLTRGI